MEAIKYFEQGYSCSESIIKEAVDLGLCDASLLPVATSFSGGMGSGCLCGTIAGAQMVIGYIYGKNNSKGNEAIARQLAKEFIDKFKSQYKATCCRVLTHGLDMHSPERKNNCKNLVEFSSKLLKEIPRIREVNRNI